MLTVKCPHCATALQLRQAPPGGKVKCPKCSKIVAVGASSAAARPAATTTQPLDPNDDNFDFGRINFPSVAGANAVSSFPVAGNLSAYTGPIPGDPLAGLDSNDPERDGDGAAAGGKTGKKKNKKSPVVWIVVIAVLLVLIIAGVVAAIIFTRGGAEVA